jgi:hypothetical protein
MGTLTAVASTSLITFANVGKKSLIQMMNEEEKSAEIMTATKQNDPGFPPVKNRSEKQIAWSKQLGQNSEKFKKEKREKEKELQEKRKEKELQEKKFKKQMKLKKLMTKKIQIKYY